VRVCFLVERSAIQSKEARQRYVRRIELDSTKE
jgi:hypothetical protein